MQVQICTYRNRGGSFAAGEQVDEHFYKYSLNVCSTTIKIMAL